MTEELNARGLIGSALYWSDGVGRGEGRGTGVADGEAQGPPGNRVERSASVNYYKATHPDGLDFRTGTINYGAALVSGEVVRHPISTAMVPNDAGTYLSVSTEPADCTGLTWPCRLLRVEPVGDVLDRLDYPHKIACLALRVVEELPAWQVLGPNGQAVVALIERASQITSNEAERLAAAWNTARGAAWAAAGAAAWDAAGGAAWDVARAAAALVVRDLIGSEQFEALTRPWREVIGATWEEAS